MALDPLTARLAREPVTIRCPICQHRQWLSAAAGRCEQCGSEITLYDDRAAAERALDALIAESRVAYITESSGLHAVVANRSFGRRGGS